MNIITCHTVPDGNRLAFVDKLFGHSYVLKLEPAIFAIAEQLAAPAYHGGYWEFFTLTNDGFYMAPKADAMFVVSCENGYEGSMSADALGITSCLYAFSHLSFGGEAFANVCAQHYHLLREFMFEHVEAKAILHATD